MVKAKPYPNRDEIEKILHMSIDGSAVWLPRPRREGELEREYKRQMTLRTGKLAGYLYPSGYRTICILGSRFLSHRLTWIVFNGNIPDTHVVDHINGNRSDNHLSNLRLVLVKDNQKNQKRSVKNTSGYGGVHMQGGKWTARCMKDGIRHVIGRFSDREMAASALRKFRLENGFSERHGL